MLSRRRKAHLLAMPLNEKGRSGEHARPANPSRYFLSSHFPRREGSLPEPEPLPS
jgi:hypothetical protein